MRLPIDTSTTRLLPKLLGHGQEVTSNGPFVNRSRAMSAPKRHVRDLKVFSHPLCVYWETGANPGVKVWDILGQYLLHYSAIPEQRGKRNDHIYLPMGCRGL